MRLLVVIALSFALYVTNARSEDPEYCYTGLEAHESGNHELAINSYTRCIDLGDLTVGNLAAAYFNRANAYYDMRDYDQAILDYCPAPILCTSCYVSPGTVIGKG